MFGVIAVRLMISARIIATRRTSLGLQIRLSSLPYRQLRNQTIPAGRGGPGSLPYRQLRKYPATADMAIGSSLPYRQLRNPR